MRILQVIHLYPPAVGGAETLIRRLSEGLVKAGHEVHVLTAAARGAGEVLGTVPADPSVAGTEEVGGVVVRRLPLRRWPRSARRALYGLAHLSGRRRWPGHGWLKSFSVGPHLPGLVTAAVRSRPDLICAAAAPFFVLFEARRAARRAGVPLAVVPCLHTGDPWHLDNPAILDLLREADAVLTLTSYESLFLRSLGLEPGRLHRVGGGVDPEVPPARPVAADGPVVLFLGRKERGKGIRQVFDACRRLWNAGIDIALAVVGAATDHSRRELADLREHPRVIWRDDVGEAEKWGWLKTCTVLAQPSRVDAFGLVYLEAWLCGKPVVAGRTGPQSALIDHERDGVLVGLGDDAELAERLREMIGRPAWAAGLGAAGRDKVLRDHTWDRVVDRARKAVEGLVR